MSTPSSSINPWSRVAGWFASHWDAVRSYNATMLRRDATAGVSVAVVAIPQSIAYALIAGVPAEYGLYTLVVHALLGSLFNASRYISIGPINTQSLLVASIVTHTLGRMGDMPVDERMALYIQLVLGLTLVKGVIQTAAAMAQLGGLAKYVSQSVIVGFTAGAGILIAVGQVPNFLGVDVTGVSKTLPGVPGTVQQIWIGLGVPGAALDWRSIGIGTVTVAAILAGRRVSRAIPMPLIMVVASGVFVWLMGWADDAAFLLVGELPGGLPPVGWPLLTWYQWESLIGGGLALAMLGLLEAHSIDKAVGERTGERVSPNHELASQGVIHVVSSWFACIPGSGSFSRSALNVYADAATRFAGAINGVVVLAVMLLFAPLARFVPLSCLAGILFVIAFALIDWRFFRSALRTDRSDAWVCTVTLAATLLTPLKYAIFIGIFLNLGLYLRQASRLQLAEMVPTPEGPFIEQPVDQHDAERKIVLLQLEGDLFFALADDLHDALDDLLQHDPRAVIFRLKRTHYVDCTVLRELEHFAREMQERGGAVILCGLRPELMDKCRDFGLLDEIGEGNVLETSGGVFASVNHAMERARQLVNDEGADAAESPAVPGNEDD